MAKNIRKKYVLKLKAVSKQVHPAIDVAAIFYMVTPSFRIPVSLLRSDRVVEIIATAKYSDVEITRTKTYMLIGPRKYVVDSLKGYKFIASTEHQMNDELTSIMGTIGMYMDRFPYLFVVIGQIVPHTSLSVFMEGVKDFIPKGYSVRLEPFIRELGGTEYYRVKQVVDMDRDKDVESGELLYMAVVPSHDITSVVFIANAPRLIELVPSKVKEFVDISIPLVKNEEKKGDKHVSAKKKGGKK